jgi:Winged helix DNA-binding domain
LTKQPVAAELTWPQVLAFRLQRQHLAERAPKKDLPRVVGDMGAAQAQVMSAAELQIAVRAACKVIDVRKALWTDRTLVKTWLMRGTLHLARADDLPLYTAAMSSRWVRVRPSWLKYMQLSENEFWKLAKEIGGALNGTPVTREELIATVGKGKSPHVRQLLKSGWGGMLKPAARNGLLCFGPNRGQSVTFVSPRKWFPTWRDHDPDEAIVEVARRYLRTNGPATKNDFASWWGAWPGVANAAWSGLAQEVVPVAVGGARLDMLESDLKPMSAARFETRVQLLPLFDPYLMGHAGRDHLFDKVHAPRVSRTAGWISAVVLVDGRVAGTWTHTANKSLDVRLAPFNRLGADVLAEVRRRASELAGAMGLPDASVKVLQDAREIVLTTRRFASR